MSMLHAALLTLGFSVSAPVLAADQDVLETELRALLEQFHADYDFPGATAAIALSDGTVISAAVGLADVEVQALMTPDSRMLAASIGKTFVAATVLSLEAEGLLARDDQISTYLGDRDWFARLPNHADITIVDLLRHTSGLADHVHLQSFQADLVQRVATGADALNPEEAIAYVFDAEPLYAAGESWAYTDTGYLLLGLIIEKVTGRTYFELVDERFLKPLGLDATTPSNNRALSGLVVGYTTDENLFGLPARTMDVDGRLFWDPATEWTGGVLISTSADLARWGHHLFTGLVMDAPYLDMLLDSYPVAPNAQTIRYGAGVAIYSDTTRGSVYGHGGWVPAYVSSLRHYADHGVTVAFQINTDVGIADDTTDLVPALEAALADLGIAFAASADSALITDVTLVDVETGTLTPDQSVLIEDGIIAAIGAQIDAGPVAQMLDGAGAYLIPGLWDSHVHIFSSPTEPDTALPLYLINGITGIRDMGALVPIADQQVLQAQIEAGEVLGPRLILAGAWVDASPGSWPGMFLADTPQDARAVVDQIADEGWAAVKSYSMLDEATYLALADSANEAGLPLVGHIPERVALDTAIETGQVGMEHFGRIPMACSTRETQILEDLRAVMAAEAELQEVFAVMAARNAIILDSWDEALCDDVLAQMAQAGMHVSPTLVVADFYTGNWPSADAPRMQMIPAAVREAWGRPDFRIEAMTDEVRALADASIALDRRTFAMAHDAGVPIVASSDASFANPYLFHGFSLLDELDIYVGAGLTPREALYTATVAPPRFFGLADHNGTIAEGQRADLVLLDANPLEGLATLRRPRAVIAGGQVLDRAALDALEAGLLAAGQ